MKRFFALVLIIGLLTTVFCISAFAAGTTKATDVIQVSGEKSDGTIIFVSKHTDFAKGWESAVDLARSETEMKNRGFVRVVVDFLADWNATNHAFGDSSDDGFQQSTIYFPQNVKMTLNLNGHTINRRLTEYELDGEVMYVDKNADVVINGGKSGDTIVKNGENPENIPMGTITGGFSCNGAGGIHINDKARITLNNVNVIGNRVEDDDGAGIALYDNATLIMNGGSVSNNISYATVLNVYGGGVYIEESNASFTGVIFQNNQSEKSGTHGAAIYADDSTVMIDDCRFIENGLYISKENYDGTYSTIDISGGSHVTIKKTKFLGNGYAQEAHTAINTHKYTSVIRATASHVTMDTCTFTDNEQVYLLESNAAIWTVSNCNFIGNKSWTFYGNCATGRDNTFTNCSFDYSEPTLEITDALQYSFYFSVRRNDLTFTDCDFGEATFNDRNRAVFVDAEAGNGVASMIGEGSLTTIVAFIALIAAIGSIVVNVSAKKKREEVTESAQSEE